MPSALPDQDGPAASATEVNDRPLSATLTVEAMTSTTAETADQCSAPHPASASMTTTPVTATQRSTRVRLPTRSLAEPTTIRPRAPTNWARAMTAPDNAAPPDDRSGRRRRPVQARDEPDQPEGRQRQLGHHEQRRQQVDAGQEAVTPVGVERPPAVGGRRRGTRRGGDGDGAAGPAHGREAGSA